MENKALYVVILAMLVLLACGLKTVHERIPNAIAFKAAVLAQE